MSLMSRLVFVYITALISSVFIGFMIIASSLAYEMEKSYKLLLKINSRIIKQRIKASNRIKLSSSMERLSQKRVGFYCWKLFIINYFRLYEVIALISMLFLKLVDISSKN